LNSTSTLLVLEYSNDVENSQTQSVFRVTDVMWLRGKWVDNHYFMQLFI